MSSSIWTHCAGDSEIRALRCEAWRAVEAQHQVSTRKLVDSDAEQQLLEQLIDSVKPPEPTGGRLHYLLFTPFRYPPLPHGSRFGARHERGIWYGSLEPRTMFSEVAYYRLLFLEGSAADLGAIDTELSVFQATVQTERGVDLTLPPFSDRRTELASPSSYGATQVLGAALREASVGAVLYESARDLEGGTNVAVLLPDAFGKRQPRGLETWHCVATRDFVELTRRDYFKRASHTFGREQFLVAGLLPAPAL